MGTICAERKGDKTYYVYRESYRVKINPQDRGKSRGSGKSTVRTRAVYLGSAEKILEGLEKTREPVQVVVRRFGLVAAAYQTALEIGLPQILMKRIPGDAGKVARWIYFFVCIINRLDNATSKNKMSQWLKKTMLPELLSLDPRKFTGRNFWYVADCLLPEKELKRTRESPRETDDLFMGMIYSKTDAKRRITDRSGVQEKLWNAFNLGNVEQNLLIH